MEILWTIIVIYFVTTGIFGSIGMYVITMSPIADDIYNNIKEMNDVDKEVMNTYNKIRDSKDTIHANKAKLVLTAFFLTGILLPIKIYQTLTR